MLCFSRHWNSRHRTKVQTTVGKEDSPMRIKEPDDERKFHRRFTAEGKVVILCCHLVKKVSVSQLCEKHDLQPTLFYRWQQMLYENAPYVLFKLPNIAFVTVNSVKTLLYECLTFSPAEKYSNKPARNK